MTILLLLILTWPFNFYKKNEKLVHIMEELSKANIIFTLDVIDYDKTSNKVLIDFITREGIVIFSTNSSG